jgi:hypothetical protein
MESFILDPRCWRIARIFGRNPLLRRADRLEAMLAVLAVIVSLVAIPMAGIAGTVVYGALHSKHTQEASKRHAVVATVAATGIDTMDHLVVQASWPVTGGDRSGPIGLTHDATVGQHVRIWVDDNGNSADPPTPVWRALTVALGTVLTLVLVTGLATASSVNAMRSRLDRIRDDEWDREIRCFQEDGGRTNRR